MASSEGADRTETQRKKWPYIVAGVVVVALFAGAVFYFMTGDDKGRRGRGRNRGEGIEQADWEVRVRNAAGAALPKKTRNQKLAGEEAKDLRRLIKSLYDAIYLWPGRVKAVTNRYMSDQAAAAVRQAGPQLPRKADRIKTLRRFARVSVDPVSNARAAVTVHVVATGENGKEEFKTQSRDELWLERSEGKWKVMAYDVRLEPLPLDPGGDKKSDNDGDNKSGDNDKKKKRSKKGSDK